MRPSTKALRSAFGGRLPAIAEISLSRALGLHRFDELYEQIGKMDEASPFLEKLLHALDIRCDAAERDLAEVPPDGATMVVANHPFGIVEGAVLTTVLRRVRPDAKILANCMLGTVPEVAEDIISVDPFGHASAAQRNRTPLREAVRWLREGRLLVVFPAGRVAHLHPARMKIRDPEWSDSVARIARLTKATVVPAFIPGTNSWSFHVRGLVHPRLRTLRLPREMLNKRGSRIEVRIGTAIPAARLGSMATDADRLEYLRKRVYTLKNRGETADVVAEGNGLSPSSPPVAAASDATVLASEVEGLPSERLLAQSGEMICFIAHPGQAPTLLREIGRAREATFRDARGGSGRPIDLDRFDEHYEHLFLWNSERREVAGSYRVGRTDHILKTHGQKGFYTSELFHIEPEFHRRISPALELGRSFVLPEYQKSFAPLGLLWKGIGRYLVLHPQYRMLYGSVGISATYSPASRQLIMDYLMATSDKGSYSHLVRPRLPPPTRDVEEWTPDSLRTLLADISDLSALVSDIEEDGKGVPVLIRQYLKLGARVLGFHVNWRFSNAVTGLVLVDLQKTEPRILRRYMGREGASRFLSYGLAPAS